MGTGSFLGVKCGRGMLLTAHPLLVPRSWKCRAIPLPTLWATPGLYSASVPVQGGTLPSFFTLLEGYQDSLCLSTGCGRKNTTIWEGHSWRWGGRTVVGSASSNSGVRAVFNVHHGVVGRTSSLYCWGVYKNWRVAGSNTAYISHPLCAWSTGGCSW